MALGAGVSWRPSDPAQTADKCRAPDRHTIGPSSYTAERGAIAVAPRAGHATTHPNDARKLIVADSVDALERGHDISCTVDPGHCSGARYERAAKHRSGRRAV